MSRTDQRPVLIRTRRFGVKLVAISTQEIAGWTPAAALSEDPNRLFSTKEMMQRVERLRNAGKLPSPEAWAQSLKMALKKHPPKASQKAEPQEDN